VDTESEIEEEPSPIDKLLNLLALERMDRDLFLGDPGGGTGRLFGGLVAAQSVVAAGLTAKEGTLHSLHAYFLRPGRHDSPLRFVVDAIRDGRTFTTRRVVALQAGEAIFNLSASFAKPEEGISHQDEMPDADGPEGLEDWELRRARHMNTPVRWRNDAIELRMCDPDDFAEGRNMLAERKLWMRPRGPLPNDPLIHAALLVYASDRTLLSTAGRPHGLLPGTMRAASLDHAFWLHHPPRFDDWILYVTNSPVAHAARGLIHGAMYSREGVRVASVTQEGLIRLPR
jgi:acyl-CoA thioesterase-2